MFFKNTFIVMEHEQALLFHEGMLKQKLAAGKHVFWGRDYALEPYDIRLQQIQVPNQELTCAEGVTVKVSAKANYRIVDVEKVYRASAHIYAVAYEALHETLRDAISSLTVEEALAKRAEISALVQEKASAIGREFGIEISDCAIRDIGISGEIKRAYGQLLIAQKEAQASLERARGETAALRNLANAAKMMDDNPNLLQLRWIHALGQVKGATIVLSPSGMIPHHPPQQESE